MIANQAQEVPLVDLPDTPLADLLEIPYMTPLLNLLETPIHVIDIAQKTTLFFGILLAVEAGRHTRSSYILYLFSGVLNGLTIDFLEENLGVRRGSLVHFVLQLAVSIAISNGMLEYVSWVW